MFFRSMFFRVQVFQDAGFSGTTSRVRVQVLEVASGEFTNSEKERGFLFLKHNKTVMQILKNHVTDI